MVFLSNAQTDSHPSCLVLCKSLQIDELGRTNSRGKISGFFEKLKGYEDKVVKGVVELV